MAIRLGVGVTTEGVVAGVIAVELLSSARRVYGKAVCMCIHVPGVAGEAVGRFTLVSYGQEYRNFVAF